VIFIGIDQTGAVDTKGRPKKLHAARLNGNHIEVFKVSKLTDLDLKDVKIIAIDSVLGLPVSAFPKSKSIRDLFQEAAKYQFKKKEFGMETAYQYFQRYLDKRSDFPKRQCEELAQANSVFQKHPFQKNIGCGTFRIWKELGADPNWFYLWPHDDDYKNLKTKPVIIEGYPSLIWKKLIQSPTRKLENLINYLKVNKITVSEKNLDPDSADAVVLAIAAKQFHLKPQTRDFKNYEQEGWIMGLIDSDSST